MKRTIAAAMMFLSAATAQAQGCPQVPHELGRIDRGLSRTTAALMFGQPLTIVALGSSSTSGAGASDETKTYPSQLQTALRARFPLSRIHVINEGIGGETVHEMHARLERSVFAHKPQLVIFQVGTNTVLRSQSVEEAEAKIHDAMRQMTVRGIDVILMDAQFAPAVESKPSAPAMQAILQRTARAFDTSVFRRNAIMRHWHDVSGLKVGQFITPDNLHMNDMGYACVARELAGAITDTTIRHFAFIP